MNTVTHSLTNEEIARVLAMYYGCEYKKRDAYMEMNAFWLYNEVWENRYDDDLRNCKLLLTPLSEITDEDAIEVAKILYPKSPITDSGMKGSGKTAIMWLFHYKDSLTRSVNYGLSILEVYQYLIQKGYAVPLFFGIDHPANGKTAIELGIAIDKTQIGYQ
jgi:hypothetical protein